MTTTKELIDSLKIQMECPKCGASWKNLTYDEIMMITQNCPVCKMRFGKKGSNEKR